MLDQCKLSLLNLARSQRINFHKGKNYGSIICWKALEICLSWGLSPSRSSMWSLAKLPFCLYLYVRTTVSQWTVWKITDGWGQTNITELHHMAWGHFLIFTKGDVTGRTEISVNLVCKNSYNKLGGKKWVKNDQSCWWLPPAMRLHDLLQLHHLSSNKICVFGCIAYSISVLKGTKLLCCHILNAFFNMCWWSLD